VRPRLGRGRAPAPADIGAAIALSRDVTWLLAGLLATAAAGGALAARAVPSPPAGVRRAASP
jgi:hypothetical protein